MLVAASHLSLLSLREAETERPPVARVPPHIEVISSLHRATLLLCAACTVLPLLHHRLQQFCVRYIFLSQSLKTTFFQGYYSGYIQL